ncbi:MAG: exosortase C-terminal domain/associated protein EpsI [bacterium]
MKKMRISDRDFQAKPLNTTNNKSMLSNRRILVVSIILIIGTILLNLLPNSRVIPIKKPLESFPRKIGDWAFSERVIFSDKISNFLGVDDYIEFKYMSPENKKIDLYVSYFSRQKEGKGFHSPKNCMPGSGWDIVQSEPVKLRISHSKPITIEINKMLIQKGSERAIVFYWFQSRGRFIRSEYMQKIYLVLDSILKHRTDGSFVRLMTFIGKGEMGQKEMDYLKEFTEQVIHILKEYIPDA